MPCRLCPGKHKHRQLPCPTDRTHYTVCRCTDVNLIYRPPSLVVILRQLCRHRAAFLCCKTVQDVKHPSFTHCTHHCTQTSAIASTLPRLTEIMISNTLPHTLTDSREWTHLTYDKILFNSWANTASYRAIIPVYTQQLAAACSFTFR